jgi:hypothetical protein
LASRRVHVNGLKNLGDRGPEKLHEEKVKFQKVAKSKVQLDRQCQGDTWKISMNSEESVSEGDKGGDHNIIEARSYEGLTHGNSPWSHKRKSPSWS